LDDLRPAKWVPMGDVIETNRRNGPKGKIGKRGGGQQVGGETMRGKKNVGVEESFSKKRHKWVTPMIKPAYHEEKKIGQRNRV